MQPNHTNEQNQSQRPKPDSQAGRILALLESRRGRKVPLPEILSLGIAQYSARIHELRHKYGLQIENGSEPGHPDHTWFKLADTDSKFPNLAHGYTRVNSDGSASPAFWDLGKEHCDLG